MALFNSGRILSGTLKNACTAFTAGKYAAGDGVTPCTVQGERVRFIFTDGLDAGEPVGLMMPGSGAIVPWLAGEALDEMDLVIVNADAKCINADAAVEGDWIVGQVVRGSSSTAEDDEVMVDFYENPQQVEPAA